MSTTSLNADTCVTVEESGVGDCFEMRNQLMSQLLSQNWEYWKAFDFAATAFNACVNANQ